MKKTILSLAFALVFGFSATATEPIEGEKKEVKTETSKVTWKAYKVTLLVSVFTSFFSPSIGSVAVAEKPNIKANAKLNIVFFIM